MPEYRFPLARRLKWSQFKLMGSIKLYLYRKVTVIYGIDNIVVSLSARHDSNEHRQTLYDRKLDDFDQWITQIIHPSIINTHCTQGHGGLLELLPVVIGRRQSGQVATCKPHTERLQVQNWSSSHTLTFRKGAIKHLFICQYCVHHLE